MENVRNALSSLAGQLDALLTAMVNAGQMR
jgi:hypothetical protein